MRIKRNTENSCCYYLAQILMDLKIIRHDLHVKWRLRDYWVDVAFLEEESR
jgi:hypothetical protein